MDERFRTLRVGDRIRILAVPGQGLPGFYLHEDTRKLFERLVGEQTILQVYRIDEWGLPWVKCCFADVPEECQDDLAIDEFDVWELVSNST
jgi:hypothetical protein